MVRRIGALAAAARSQTCHAERIAICSRTVLANTFMYRAARETAEDSSLGKCTFKLPGTSTPLKDRDAARLLERQEMRKARQAEETGLATAEAAELVQECLEAERSHERRLRGRYQRRQRIALQTAKLPICRNLSYINFL